LSEHELVCEDLNLALDDLRREGFRIELIYPADDPHTAILSREGTNLRLTTRPGAPPVPTQLAPFCPEFVFTPAGGSAGEGRAGMLYRDLVPSRLGGRYIASHIIIQDGGPVSDWVHYHRITFQIIAVRSGWVRVVYEDQGEPFVMKAGDLVLQPPGIRHRVLESSPGLEVIEITAPAVHETFADHELELPNGRGDPGRLFSGQRFLRHIAGETRWTGFLGGEAQETRLQEATDGLADARLLRLTDSERLEVPPHDGELVLGFVLEGSGELQFGDRFALAPADAFVIPPGEPWNLIAGSDGLRPLHVTSARMG
jgi:mannose-6-phosphate isomerase-like protein (cupin superfamily)